MYPAALTTEVASPKMSSRYVHVSTNEVLNIMQEQGYSVANVSVDKTRKNDPTFARHLVSFRRDDLQVDGGYVPQMLWLNSHNGKTPAMMMLGCFRFVCSNGLVIGSAYAQEKVRHSGDLARQIVQRVSDLSKSSTKLFEQIETWSKVDLSRERRLEFANQAMKLRFGDKSAAYNVEDLIQVRRAEDDRGDLWSTFNRIQENASKGGMIGVNANNRQVRSRSIGSIGQDLNFNRDLWTLAESFA